mmetsp:Transcript_15585/g.24913  ORF Transcript_15585/g.24913 Transcript_15585/m.24913 type:complete len:432 (-) Transcript_15585:1341-2636(-)
MLLLSSSSSLFINESSGMGHVSLGTERKLCLANCTLIRTDSPAGLGSSQLISSLGYTVHGYSASSHVMEFSFPAPLQSGIWRQLKETDCIRSRCSDNTGSRCRVRRFQQSAFPKKSNSHLGKRTTPQVPMCVAGSRANPNVVAFGGGEDNGGGGRICVLNTANMEILAEFTTKAPVSSLCFLSHIDSKMKGNQENVLATLTNDGTLSAFPINLMKKQQQQQPKTFISPIAEKSIWEVLSIASSNEDEKEEVSVNGKQQKHEDVSSDATTTTTDKLNKNSSIVGKIIPHPHDEGSCLYYVCSAAAASESSSKKKKKIQGAVVRLTYCSSKKENMMGVKRCSSGSSNTPPSTTTTTTTSPLPCINNRSIRCANEPSWRSRGHRRIKVKASRIIVVIVVVVPPSSGTTSSSSSFSCIIFESSLVIRFFLFGGVP